MTDLKIISNKESYYSVSKVNINYSHYYLMLRMLSKFIIWTSLGTTFMSCLKYNQKNTGFSPNRKLMFNNIKSIPFNKFIIFLLKCNLFFMMFSLISNVIPNELNFFVLYVCAKARFSSLFFNAINGVANYFA